MTDDLRIIALYGRSNTGKTGTLKQLIDKMRNSNFKDIGEYKIQEAEDDLCCVLEYLGKKIGITTLGDGTDVLEDAFDFMTRYNCDLYICATHTKGKTVKFVEKRTENGVLIWHSKWKISKRENREYEKLDDDIYSVINSAVADGMLKTVIKLLRE